MDYSRTAPAVAAGVSALAFHLGTGLEPLWIFAWVAPLPVLAIAYRVSARLAVAVALGAWVLGNLSQWLFLGGALRVPVVVVALLVAVSGIAFCLTVMLSRALLRRGAPWSAALAVPAAWVTFEFLVARLSPDGTAGNLAYSQVAVLPVVQLASVTGLWGVTFLVMAVPAAVAVATRSPGRRLAIAGVAAALLVVTLGFGAWRLARSEDSTPVTVGLAASDVGLRAFATTDPGEALAVVETYATAIEALAARGAQVIVLPEKLVGVTAAYRDDVERRLADAAARHRVLLVAGLNEIATPSRRNVALVFAADGTSAGRYRKRHHIPGLEAGYAPGDAPLLVSGTQPPWGVAICKDLDFPALGREYAGRGAGLMLVPAWDFVADAWQHERMAAMRAIESGFALARSAKQGLLTVRDARGRLVAAARSDSAPVALLAASVKVRHDATVYARYGDWFAWLCVIGAAAVVVRLVTVTFGRSAREDAWAATA